MASLTWSEENLAKVNSGASSNIFKQQKFVSYRSRAQNSAIGGDNKGEFKKGFRPPNFSL